MPWPRHVYEATVLLRAASLAIPLCCMGVRPTTTGQAESVEVTTDRASYSLGGGGGVTIVDVRLRIHNKSLLLLYGTRCGFGDLYFQVLRRSDDGAWRRAMEVPCALSDDAPLRIDAGGTLDYVVRLPFSDMDNVHGIPRIAGRYRVIPALFRRTGQGPIVEVVGAVAEFEVVTQA